MSRHRDPISTALEDLLSRFGAVVRRAGLRHGLADAEIDALVQDVRIRIWRALEHDESIAELPASYVYRTAMSAAVDMIRRRRARREQPLDPAGPPPDADVAISGRHARPDEAVERDEAMELLRRALEDLSDSRRPVVRMHLAGYHRSEIAELLGWTEAKTRNLLYRGLADLREALERRGYAPGVRA
ncbi:MAG: RNA polymerase sigma factor [Gemmatimonadota bacterium]